MQLLLKFVIGGLFVCLFSLLGDSFEPNTFAGLFGAAPSIALAGLILSGLMEGISTAAIEAHSMIFGAIALIFYSLGCGFLVGHTHLNPWIAACILWIGWAAVALALFGVFLK